MYKDIEWDMGEKVPAVSTLLCIVYIHEHTRMVQRQEIIPLSSTSLFLGNNE